MDSRQRLVTSRSETCHPQEQGLGWFNTGGGRRLWIAPLDRPGGISTLMVSLRRLAFSLAVCAFAGTVSFAQSSSSDAAPPAQQPAAQQPATSGPLTVQARLRARREQRRATAIHDVYSHLYEAYVGSGYERFTPGPGIPAQAGLAHTG